MRLIKLLAAAAMSAALPALSQTAATFPERDKPLKIIVPFAAGGGVDAAARCSARNCRSSSA